MSSSKRYKVSLLNVGKIVLYINLGVRMGVSSRSEIMSEWHNLHDSRFKIVQNYLENLQRSSIMN